jgi:tetratricopeptide (TPR) repeat protein
LASAQDNLVSGKYDLALAEFEAALKDAQARGDAGREARVLAAYGYALYLRDRGKAAESKEIERHLQPAFEHLQKALKAAARSRDNDLEGWIRITLGLPAQPGFGERQVYSLEV